MLQQEVLHGLARGDACRGGGRRGAGRRRCGHGRSRGAQVVAQELQDREVVPLGPMPVHVASAELRGRGPRLRGQAQRRREAGEGRGAGQGRVAILQRLLVGLGADLGHAGLGPGPPVDGQHPAGRLAVLRQLAGAAEGGELVQLRVGRAIVDLPGVAEERGRRGEAHGPMQRPSERPGGAEERGQEVAFGHGHLAHALLRHALHDAVVQDARKVQHACHAPELAEGAGEESLLAVHPLHLHGPAARELARDGRRACTPEEDELLRKESLFLQHPFNDRLPEAAGRAGQDEDREAAVRETLWEAGQPGAGLGHGLQARGVDGAPQLLVLHPDVRLEAVPAREREQLPGPRLRGPEARGGQEEALDLQLAGLQADGLAGARHHGTAGSRRASEEQPAGTALLEQALDQLDEVPGLADLRLHLLAAEHGHPGSTGCQHRCPSAHGRRRLHERGLLRLLGDAQEEWCRQHLLGAARRGGRPAHRVERQLSPL
mmetsp:Transcript_46236/g.143061  ORF Transcript_46236/g.143061 Transcript_46236/m.143061 type:complete len:489 (-) Transcript_46236:4707-6173(-)